MKRLVKFFEGATAPFLAKAAIIAASIAAGLLLSLATALWFQTWRIGNLQERNGALGAQLGQCVQANATNITTINELERANLLNRTRAEDAIRRLREAADRVTTLEQQLREGADDDIDAINEVQSDCADRDAPDAIRLLVSPSHYGDANSGGAGRGSSSD